jgi:hypothetical protein
VHDSRTIGLYRRESVCGTQLALKIGGFNSQYRMFGNIQNAFQKVQRSYPMGLFDRQLSPSWLVIALFFELATSSACAPGIEFEWKSPAVETYDRAYFDSDDYPDSHDPWMRGSFIASVSDRHQFTMAGETYGTSSWYTPKIHFRFDGVNYPTSDDSYTLTIDLTRDFRYSFFNSLGEGFLCIKIWLYVSWPGHAKAYVDKECAEIC